MKEQNDQQQGLQLELPQDLAQGEITLKSCRKMKFLSE